MQATKVETQRLWFSLLCILWIYIFPLIKKIPCFLLLSLTFLALFMASFIHFPDAIYFAFQRFSLNSLSTATHTAHTPLLSVSLLWGM